MIFLVDDASFLEHGHEVVEVTVNITNDNVGRLRSDQRDWNKEKDGEG